LRRRLGARRREQWIRGWRIEARHQSRAGVMGSGVMIPFLMGKEDSTRLSRGLRRVQWLTLALAMLAVLAFSAYLVLARGISPSLAVVDGAIGVILAAVLIWFCFHLIYRLYDKAIEEHERLAVLQRVANALGSTLDLPALLNLVMEQVTESLGVEAGLLMLVDAESKDLVFEVVVGGGRPELVGTRVSPGEGIAGAVAESGRPLIINDVQADTRWYAGVDRPSGFHTRAILCVPLMAHGELIGVIEAINKRNGQPFVAEDQELLTSIASQAALAIENARRYTVTDRSLARRVREMAIVNEINRAISASLDLETTLTAILESTRKLLDYDAAEINLWDAERGVLVSRGRAGDPSYTEQAGGVYRLDEGYTGWIATHREPLLVREVGTEQVRPKLADKRWPFLTFVGIPLLVGDTLVGTLELARFAGETLYTEEDVRTLQTIAGQAAIAIQNANLYALTDERLHERVSELAGLMRIGRELNATLDLERILNLVLDEATRATGAPHGAIHLFNPHTGRLEVGALRGLAPEQEEEVKKAELQAGKGITGRVLATGESALVSDVAKDPDYFPLLPETRSEAAVPIRYAGTVAGVIHLESDGYGAFTPDDIHFLEALADQAAVAIGNARAYTEQVEQREELYRRAEQLARLAEVSYAFRSDRPLAMTLEDIVFSIEESVGFNVVLLSLVEGIPPMLHLTAAAGVPLPEVEALKQRHQPLAELEQLMREGFRLGQSYFIPHQHKEVAAGLPVYKPLPPEEKEVSPGMWHPDDLLVVPLRNTEGQLLGQITLDTPRDGRVPTRAALETLEVFAGQAAIAVENARLYAEATTRAQQLSVLNEIGRAISALLDLDQVLETVYQSTRNIISTDLFFIALYDPMTEVVSYPLVYDRGKRCLEESGRLQKGSALERAILQRQTALVVRELAKRPVDRPGEGGLDRASRAAASLIFVPLVVGDEAIGAMSVQSYRPHAYSDDHLTLLSGIANQAAIAIANARLYEMEQRRRQMSDALRDLGEVVSSSLDLGKVLETLLRNISPVIPYDTARVMLIERDGDTIRFAATQGYETYGVTQEEVAQTTFSLKGTANLRHMARTRLPTIVADTKQSSGWIPTSVHKHVRCSLGAPLIARDQAIGFLVLDKVTPNFYQGAHAEALAAFAPQAAIAIANARLYEAEQERRQTAEALRELAEVVSSTLEADEVLRLILEQLQRVVPYDTASIQLLRDGQLTIIGGRGFANLERVLGSSFSTTGDNPNAEVVRRRAPLIVADAQAAYSEFRQEPYTHIRSWLGVPLLYGDELLGMIALDSTQLDFYHKEHARLALTFANQAAVAIQNARLYEETVQRGREEALLNQALRAVTSTLDLEAALVALEQGVREMVPHQRLGVALLDETEENLEFVQLAGAPSDPYWTNVKRGVELAGQELAVEATYLSPARNEVGAQIEVVEDCIARRVDGIALAPMDSAALEPLIRKARAAGIVVITLDTPPVADSTCLAYVGTDNVSAGMKAGMAMARLLPQGGVVGMSGEWAGALNTQQRAIGFVKALADMGIVALDPMFADGELDKAIEQATQLTSVHPDLAGALGLDALGGPAWGQVAREMGRAGSFQIVAFDASPPNIALLKNGVIQALVTQREQEMGYQSVRLLASMITAGPETVLANLPGGVIETETDMVTLDGTEWSISLREYQAQQFAGAHGERASAEERAVARAKARELGHPLRIVVIGQWHELRELRRGKVAVAGSLLGRAMMEARGTVFDLVSDEEECQEYADAMRARADGTRMIASLPLVIRGRPVGLLSLESEAREAYGEAELQLLQRVGDITAVALENSRLYTEAQRRARELETIGQVGRRIASILDLDELLVQVVEIIHEAFAYDRVNIFLIDEASGYAVLRSSSGEAGRLLTQKGLRLRIGSEGMIGWVAANAEVLLANDITAEPRYKPSPLLPTTRSEVSVPLLVGKRVIGVLDIQDDELNAFSEEDLFILRALGDQIAVAIENARLVEQTQRRAQGLLALQRTSVEIARRLESEQLLQAIVERATYLVRAKGGMLYMVEPDRKTLRVVVSHNLDRDYSASAIRLGEGVAGQAVETGEVTIGSAEPPFGTTIGVPLRRGGDVRGVLNIFHEAGGLTFSEDDVWLLNLFVSQATIALENARLFEELEQRVRELAALTEVSSSLNKALDLDEVLDIVLGAVFTLIGRREGSIFLIDQRSNTLRIASTQNIPMEMVEAFNRRRVPADSGTFGMVARTGQVLEIADVHNDPLADAFRSYGIPIADSLTSIPLKTERGVIGILMIETMIKNETIRSLVVTLADLAAVAIDNVLLFQERERRIAEMTILNQTGQALSATLDADALLELVYHQASQALDTSGEFYIALYGEETDEVTFAFRARNNEITLYDGKRRAGQGLTECLIRTRKPLLIRHGFAEKIKELDVESDGPLAESWLGVPMVAGDRVLGMMAVQSYTTPDLYDEEHLNILTTIAGQTAIALENIHLLETTRQRADEMSLLYDLGVAITATLNLEDVMELVAENVLRLIGTDLAIINVYDEETGRYWRASAAETSELAASLRQRQPRRMGLTRVVMESGKPIIIEDAGQDQRVSGTAVKAGVRSILGVPVSVAGQTIGVIFADSIKPRRFTEREVTLLSFVATQAAVAIRNAQFYHRIGRFTEELEEQVQDRTRALGQALKELTVERDRVETLYRITRQLSASLDLDRVLMEALSLINEAIGVSKGSIMLLDPATGQLIYRAALGRRKPLPRGGQPTQFRPGVGLAGWVMEHRKAVILENIAKDPRWLADPDEETGSRSAIAVPLGTGEDVVGVLLLFHPEPGYFTDTHLKLVSAAAAQIATAINNAELYNLITDQAERLGLMLHAQQAEASKSQAILESITDGVLVIDNYNRVLLMNTAAEEILGIAAQVLIGQHIRHLLGLGETQADRDIGLKFYSELMPRIERVEAGAEPQQFRLESGDKVVVVSLAPVVLESGELPSMVAVLRDISHEAEVDRIKNEFISTVSHELRTPMTSIKGYTDLLVMEAAGDLTETQRRFLNIIKSNADRLTALVSDILDISRIETGRIKLDIGPQDISQVIQEVAEAMKSQAEEKGLNLIVELPEELPAVRGDRDRITQILVNLIANACQYSWPGGLITVSAAPHDGEVQVDVADTGIGIGEQDLDRIFDRFYRADQPEVRATSGTGLGLSIVKMFVEMLGGHVRVKSELGKGSTFSFTLPTITAIEPMVEIPGPEGVAVGVEPLVRVVRDRPKILVVDDDRDIAGFLRHQLELEGYDVLVAYNGEDAVWLAQEERPNLITLDIFMEGIEGFKVLENLKEDATTAGIPVIILPILAEGGAHAFALGATDYLIKPFEERQLLQSVRQVLEPLGDGQLNRVLVVDDDQQIVSWLLEALTVHGYEVRTATTGREALALAAQTRPDVILLDLKMPDMDSYQIIRRLRRQQSTQSVPIIITTDRCASAIDKERDKVWMLGLGTKQLLTEPFSIEMLIQEIKKVGHESISD
jgi:PAS domain S-box-containing protein